MTTFVEIDFNDRPVMINIDHIIKIITDENGFTIHMTDGHKHSIVQPTLQAYYLLRDTFLARGFGYIPINMQDAK